MLTPDDLDRFAEGLARLNGIPLEVAERYAALIGDTPELSEDGRVVVRDDADVIIATVVVERDED